MTPCEECRRLESMLYRSADVVLYAAHQAARLKDKKAKDDAIARVGLAQKERGEAGRLWAQHLESHEDKLRRPS
jgi:hypothetical protein